MHRLYENIPFYIKDLNFASSGMGGGTLEQILLGISKCGCIDNYK